jgi:hypothetical protein
LAGYCFLKSSEKYKKGIHDDEAMYVVAGIVLLAAAEIIAIIGAKI